MNFPVLKKPKVVSIGIWRSLFFSTSTSEPPLSDSLLVPETYASLLENSSGIDSLKKLHACIFIRGLQNNTFLCTKLINSYAKFRLLTESRCIFRRIINNNLSLWNSVLVGYFRAGFFDEVLRLYLHLRERGFGIHSSAITFSLKSCIELGNFRFGRGVHLDSVKFGLSAGRFVGSSLICMYFSYGDTDEAAKVFDEITQRDIVVYTSMITGYAEASDDHAYKAFEIAFLMQKENLDPNRVTLVGLLQAAALLRALEEGKIIHGYALRREICLDEVFDTSLMDMYIKCGEPNKASTIFTKTSTKRTVASYNALITGHLQLGQPLKAFEFFSKMVQENLEPDLISLANGLLSCADLDYSLAGKSIHCYVLRNGLQLDLVATTSLIDMYSKCHYLIQAKEIFDQTEKKDVILFNVMIAGHFHNGFLNETIELFHQMVRIGIRPNPSTLFSIVSALADLKDTRKGKLIHGYVIKHGFGSNTEIANQIIFMYAKCGIIDFGRQIFDRIKEKDLVSWTSMMMGYVNHGHADEAIALFRSMQREKQLNPDSITFVSLLQAFCQLGFLGLAKEIHCQVLRLSMENDVLVINSLLTTYSKCGKLTMARDLFDRVFSKSLASFNTMIAAYGNHGFGLEAIQLFNQMKREKFEPDELTFTSVLSACSHSGMIEEGLDIFKSMDPLEDHYSCVVDMLSRGGRLEEAYDLLTRCLPLRENGSALGALVAACRVQGNTEMGGTIGRLLLDLEPRNSSAYGLVSNLYAGGEKWDEAARVRAVAKERGLKRVPGYSLVEFR